ncbi:hypothetical protein L1049_016717 [Liquidambar formosana]|uniref:Preprotein translocase subunit SECE1 n=1 Tax=Liquidambar formosana TaxID=63359 RepID=A0AAP0S0B9_LIQFO
MALHISLQFPLISFPPPAKNPLPTLYVRTKPTLAGNQFRPLAITSGRRRKRSSIIINAVEEGRQDNESQTVSPSSSDDESEAVSRPADSSGEVSELGSEIKKAMQERKATEGEGDLWSGVAEEVREIEWPAFGKVLGTTWVVLGVIAGSSVVLLTVNAILAELSDRVFAGKGVQDFFG